MTRTWTLLGSLALLAAALAASPVRAEPEKNDPLNEYKKLDDIKTTLADMQKQLQALIALQKVQADLTALTEKVAQLQRDVEVLRNQSGPVNRIAMASPAGTPPGVPAPAPGVAVGRILLRNTYTDRVSVIVNGRSYPLDPGAGWMLENQPLGPFTFEVLGGPTGIIQPRQDRVLTAEKPYEITVYTR